VSAENRVRPDQLDPKVTLDCKDNPAPRVCVERLAPPDNLERPVPPECPAPQASVARWECRALKVSAENRVHPDPQHQPALLISEPSK
jgi:hypothetical protein